MDKINFENLPSTNTPLNATTLNNMQNGIEKSANYIGSTQPSTGEKVWVKKGKNLFDKKKTVNGFRYGSDGMLYADSDFSALNYIEVSSNTQYTVSWTISTTQCVCYYDGNKSFISRNGSEKTFTTPSNCKYIGASVLTSNINSAQIELGSSSTTFEPYIDKEILIKNNAGAFEKLYSENLADGWRRAVLSNYVQGEVKYLEIGKVVIVVFDDFRVINDITENFVSIVTGLPPSLEYGRTALIGFPTPEGFRIAITTDGKIINHYSTPVASTKNFYGNLIYIAK